VRPVARFAGSRVFWKFTWGLRPRLYAVTRFAGCFLRMYTAARVVSSEGVPQRELHDASGFGFVQRGLGGGEFAEFLARVAETTIGIGAETEVSDG